MAVRVVDKSSGEEVEVASGEAEKGYLQGRYDMPSGQVLVARGNSTGRVDASKLQGSLASGWSVVDQSEHAQRKKKAAATSTTGQLRGGVESAARGASFGLSDVVSRGLGADTEAMRLRKEALGAVGTGLELAGAAAPALLTGGASAGATGAARAGSVARSLAVPARGVAKIGLAAAERAGGSKARQMAVQGVAEGFFQGMGEVVSEDALGDRDLTGERLLAGGAKGAVLGGLLGGGMGKAGDGLAAVARGGKRVSKGLMSTVAGLGDDVGDPAFKSAMAKGGNMVERGQHAQLAALGGGVDDHLAMKHLNNLRRTKEGRQMLTEAEGKGFDDLVGSRLRTSIGGTDTTKALEGFGAKFAKDARGAGLSATAERMGRFQDRLKRITRGGGEAADTIKEVRKLLRRGNKDGKLFERMASGSAKAPKNAHRYLTKTLDDIDAVLTKRQGTLGTEKIAEELAPLRQLADDKLLWGGRAGSARTLYAAKDAERAAMAALPEGAQKALVGVPDGAGAKLLAKNETGVAAVLDARENIVKALADAGEDVKGLRKGMADTRKALGYRGELQKTSDAWGRMKALGEGGRAKAARAGIEGLGMITGGGFGGLAGAFGGRLTGEMLGGVTRPAALLSTMTRLRQAVDMVARREGAIVKGAERLAEGGAKAAKKAARAAREVGGQTLRTGRGAALKRRKRLEQVRRSVTQLALKPEEIPDKLGEGMNEIRAVAPEAAMAMGQSAVRAVSFLASKAPDAYTPPFSTETIVDEVEMGKFARYVAAVEDPLGAIAALEQGALSLESVEVLRDVYPQMYQELQEGTMEMVGARAKSKKPVSFEARTQLGMLLSLPLDQALVPGFRQRLASGAPPPQEPPPPVPQSNVNAAANVDATGSTVTGVGRLEAGGEHS